VRLRQPFAPAISIFAQPWTAIVPQGDLLAENPAGSGPFRLVSHSGALRLERKTDYWRTPAAWVDAVVVTPASTAPREASFAAGSSDLAASLPFGSLPQGARRLPAPGLNVASLAFNTRRAPFGDVRVRTALSQIIDRARTVRDLGIPAQPTGLPIGPAQWQFSPALQGQVTDVTGGRALLQHAGAQGLRLTVIAEDGPNVARLTQLIGRDWTAEGITAQFDILDSVAYRQRLQAGSFDAALILDAQPQHDAWWSLADAYLGASAARPSGWSNPAFEQAVSQAVAARIHEEAEPFWRDAIGILVAETPHAYLFSPASLTWLGVGPRVRDAIWAGPLLRWDTLWLNQ
jgi:ABC-type transport system substrate-binding protein